MFNPLNQWLDEINGKRDEIQAEAARIEADKQTAERRRKALKISDAPDTIGAFNQAYSVADILIQAGYDQCGDKFRHPRSESGSFSATVKDERVHSLSLNDPLYTNGGGVGAHDAFSAFTILFHRGNSDAALKDAGDQWLTINGEPWNKVKRREYMHKKEALATVVSLDDLPALNAKHETEPKFDIEYPPGLAGDLAKYIYKSSRVPVKSYSIAGAITTLSHLNENNQFVADSNTSLNLYQCLVGNTGKGKEDPRKAVKRIIDAAGISPNASIHEILASGAALLRSLENKPKTLILIGEFGLYLQTALSDRGSIHQKEFVKDSMVLFGLGRSYFAGKSYANKKQNIGRIEKPYVNLLATTTPLELMDGITVKTIDNGFLNRILIIPASEENPINRKPDIEINESLKQKILNIINPLFLSSSEIYYEEGAHELLVQFADQLDNRGQFANLWSRAEEQTIKIAGLLAIGDGGLIKRDHVTWALKYVEASIKTFINSLDKGLVESSFQKDTANALNIIANPFKYSNDLQFSKYCKKGLMPRGKLTKLLKLRSRDVTDIVVYLTETGQISHCDVEGVSCYQIL